MAWIGYAVGAAVGVVGNVIAGNKQASAAKKQANAQNAATDRQLAYDTELWEMNQEHIIANRAHAAKEIEIQARNEGRTAAFKDATNLQRYNYDLMIRNREQTSLNQQYLRSDDIYNKQVTLNSLSAQAASTDEYRKLREIQSEAQFDSQDAYVESLISTGKMRAMGLSGRSAEKADQSDYAKYGRAMSAINETVDAAGRNTHSIMQEIARDKASADLAAYAQKMLDPGTLPMPIVPFATPIADRLYPRELLDYDFGPAPVAGAYASPSAAASMAWGSAIQGIAGSISGGVQAYGAKHGF